MEDSFTLVFLTPMDMAKLKMVENHLLKPQLQTVCLHSSKGFVSQRCPDVAILPQGHPQCTERMKKLSLVKTQWGRFDSVTSPIPQPEAGIIWHLFF